ncbi:papain-like cysteine protease family protein [Actinoplanes sp. NBRC 103695]|uniref:papain-like cysteine protease family protein n=1 Tax=Actinoplanes sp. NBRC 103695 TaxID=3032202 RepID=UPI0025540910|nr:papain-like cysteine protease family protein [Actinoplanes sp. NBRC 103695]
MAENIQETGSPEPPPKPAEVPKPTAQSNRAEAVENPPPESQQSARQDARDSAHSEHRKATGVREPQGSYHTPEFQGRLDRQTAAKDGPEGLRPTPEVQTGLDTHTAAKVERDGSARQNAGGQSSERAAAHQSAADEYIKANPQATPSVTPEARTSPADATQSQAQSAQESPHGEPNRHTDVVDEPVRAVDESHARQAVGDQSRQEAPDAGTDGRAPAAETDQVSGAGGDWETIDEQPGGAVGQVHPLSCTSACGEMLSGRPQDEFIEKLGVPAAQGDLAKALGPEWRAVAIDPGQPGAVSGLCENGPWAADLWNAGERIHHTVIVDGIDDNNQVSIRDPWDGGSTYRMSWNAFDGVWSGVAVIKREE